MYAVETKLYCVSLELQMFSIVQYRIVLCDLVHICIEKELDSRSA